MSADVNAAATISPSTPRVTILQGDVREVLRTLPSAYFDCVVTSPPYWGLRDYGVAGQIGLEPTLAEHLDVLVGVFREVRRVLKAHGTVWLNYGDCYAAAPNGKSAAAYKADGTDDRTFRDKPFSTVGPIYDPHFATARGKFTGTDLGQGGAGTRRIDHGGRIVAGGFLKPKDLCMVPNRLAIALQDDGWWVRSEIIWHKPNPMPESTYDRPTSAHEKVWLLTKSEDYFYNNEAIREPVTGGAHARAAGRNSRQHVDRTPVSKKVKVPGGWDTKPGAHGTTNGSGRTSAEYVDADAIRGRSTYGRHTLGEAVPTGERRPGVTPKHAAEGSNVKAKASFLGSVTKVVETRNARNVWTIAPRTYREAHFATFPPRLAELCMLAGVPALACAFCGHALPQPSCHGACQIVPAVPGRVLDPFGGAGTVGVVAQQLGVDATLIELNAEYVALSRKRIGLDQQDDTQTFSGGISCVEA